MEEIFVFRIHPGYGIIRSKGGTSIWRKSLPQFRLIVLFIQACLTRATGGSGYLRLSKSDWN